jgi:aspartate racemase
MTQPDNESLYGINKMKTLGLIGGIAPESTIAYYRLLVDSYRQKDPNGNYPSIIINSINLKRVVSMMETNALADLTEYLWREVQKLANAGADFGLLASNTPHIVFDELRRQSPLPLLSIVEATCAAAKVLRLKRLGLFGTRFTMQARFYPEVFARDEMTLVTPNRHEQDYIHDIYMRELINGIFLPETRERLLQIVERMKNEENIHGLILGGTELPLILRDDTYNKIPLLDTARIHVEQAVRQLLS